MDAQKLRVWRRNAIPYPKPISKRENEHLQTCADCQSAWPLFFAEFASRENLSSCSARWEQSTEQERLSIAQSSQRKLERMARKRAKQRDPTAYVLFLKQRKFSPQEVRDLPFKERNRIVNAEWRQLSAEAKAELQNQARELKQRRLVAESNAPKFEQRLLENGKHRIKRQKLAALSAMVYKPRNAFFLFLQDEKEKENLKPAETRRPYKEVISTAAAFWRQSSPELKLGYKQRSAQLTQLYLQEKQAQKIKSQGCVSDS